MAYDPTKPTMSSPNWATILGDIRENFRAIVQGDANVFTALTVTGGASVADFVLGQGGGNYGMRFRKETTGSTFVGSLFVSDHPSSAASVLKIFGFNGATTPWFMIDTNGNVSINGTSAGAKFQINAPAATVTTSLSMTGTTTAYNIMSLSNTGCTGYVGVESSAGAGIFFSTAAYAMVIGTASNTHLQFGTNNNMRATVTNAGSFVMGTGALTTTATDGFIYLAAGAGAPTGTPTAFTGRIPMYFDLTNNFLYIYNGGWKKTTVFA